MEKPMVPPSECLLWDVREGSRQLSVSTKTLWNHTMPRGSIPCVRVGQRVLYDPNDLREWIARQKGGRHGL
jgi:hypothetical protein